MPNRYQDPPGSSPAPCGHLSARRNGMEALIRLLPEFPQQHFLSPAKSQCFPDSREISGSKRDAPVSRDCFDSRCPSGPEDRTTEHPPVKSTDIVRAMEPPAHANFLFNSDSPCQFSSTARDSGPSACPPAFFSAASDPGTGRSKSSSYRCKSCGFCLPYVPCTSPHLHRK